MKTNNSLQTSTNVGAVKLWNITKFLDNTTLKNQNEEQLYNILYYDCNFINGSATADKIYEKAHTQKIGCSIISGQLEIKRIK